MKSCLLINAFDLESVTVKPSTGNLALPFGRFGPWRRLSRWEESVTATKAGQDENRQSAQQHW
jgi:hypothetical protein